MNRLVLSFIAWMLFAGRTMAELPHAIKIMADQYDASLKAHALAETTRVQMARDKYLAHLNAERRYAVGGKRDKEVAAIDQEVKAVNAGPLKGPAPDGLTSSLLIYRKQYVEAPEKERRFFDKERKRQGDTYLKWLDQMEAATARGEDKVMKESIASERKRVLANLPADAAEAPKKP